MKKLIVFALLLIGCSPKYKPLGISYEDYPSISRKWVLTDWDKCIRKGIDCKGCQREYWELVRPDMPVTPPKKVQRLERKQSFGVDYKLQK